MSKPFATVAEVARRAAIPASSAEEIALVESLLEIVSEEIRAHGEDWPDPFLAPAVCRTVCINAATRGYLNPAGFETERGDMFTAYRGDKAAQGESLSASEIRQIKAVSHGGGISSIPITRPVLPAPGVVEEEDLY